MQKDWRSSAFEPPDSLSILTSFSFPSPLARGALPIQGLTPGGRISKGGLLITWDAFTATTQLDVYWREKEILRERPTCLLLRCAEKPLNLESPSITRGKRSKVLFLWDWPRIRETSRGGGKKGLKIYPTWIITNKHSLEWDLRDEATRF